MEDLLYMWTTTANYMNQTEKRLDKLEKMAKHSRKTSAFLLGVCLGLAVDVYKLAKEVRKAKKEEEKSGD